MSGPQCQTEHLHFCITCEHFNPVVVSGYPDDDLHSDVNSYTGTHVSTRGAVAGSICVLYMYAAGAQLGAVECGRCVQRPLRGDGHQCTRLCRCE